MRQNKIKVGWLSRHSILPAQEKELRRLLGNVEVVVLKGSLKDGGLKDADEVARLCRESGVQYAVIVAPLALISFVLEKAKKEKLPTVFLRAEMKELKGNEPFEPDKDVLINKRHYRFQEFRVLKAVKLVTEPFEEFLKKDK